MNDNTGDSRSGISGAARMVVGLVVVALAALGILVVFEVIPRETLVNVSSKIVFSAVIFLAASLAIGMLSKR